MQFRNTTAMPITFGGFTFQPNASRDLTAEEEKALAAAGQLPAGLVRSDGSVVQGQPQPLPTIREQKQPAQGPRTAAIPVKEVDQAGRILVSGAGNKKTA